MTDERLYSGRRFRTGLRAFFIGRTTQAITTAGLLLLAVRLLDPRDYGAYLLIWGICELAVPLTSLGLLQAAQQFLPRLASNGRPDELRHFVNVMERWRYAMMVIASLGVGFAWPSISAWLGMTPSSPNEGLVVALLLFVVLGARFAAEMLESLLEQRDAQLVRALQQVCRLLGLLALWAFGQLSLMSLLWLDVAVSAAVFVLGKWRQSRRLRSLQGGGDEALDWRQVRAFIGHMSLSQLLWASGDTGAVRLVVGRVLGVEAAGVFGFLQQLVIIANRYLPSMLLANIVRPMLISRLAEGDRQTVGTGVALLWKLNLLVVLGALAVVLAGGDRLPALLSGGAAAGSGLALLMLTFGLLATASNQAALMALQLHDQAPQVVLISLMAPFALLFGWLGGHWGGVAGAAAGVAAALWLRGLAGTWRLQRGPFRAPLDWPCVARLAVGTAVIGGVAWFAASLTGALAAALAAAAAFVAMLRWLQPFSANEAALAARGLGRWGRLIRSWSRP